MALRSQYCADVSLTKNCSLTHSSCQKVLDSVIVHCQCQKWICIVHSHSKLLMHWTHKYCENKNAVDKAVLDWHRCGRSWQVSACDVLKELTVKVWRRSVSPRTTVSCWVLRLIRLSGQHSLWSCFELWVPVQVIAWKDSSLKWPIMCRLGRKTLLTHALRHVSRCHSCYYDIQGAAKKMTQHQKCDNSVRLENFCAKFCVIVWQGCVH